MAVESRRKRRKLSPPEEHDASGDHANTNNSFLTNAARWTLEQDYESRRHKGKNATKEKTRLPIKTEDSRIEYVAELSEDSGEDGTFSGIESDGAEESNDKHEPQLSSREEILQSQEELARIADLINQDPEEHITGLNTLAKFSQSNNLTVKKLALVTQLAVFKDVIPGYRIKPRGEDALQEKLSKDVKRLRTFEQGLISAYQDYVRILAATVRPAKNARADRLAVSKVALSCICQLLLAVPHFNFRGELLKPLVSKISSRKVDTEFKRCISTFEELFRDDEEGNASRESVNMIAQMMRSRDYNVDESVVNTFLHLRLLTQLSVKGSKDRIDRATETQPKLKRKQEFVNKKQRKARRELKELEKEFAEADATVQHEEREKMQSETLKIVFGAYFRILKTRSPKLMGAVLEGLARYAHLINQDFFGDLLVTLQDLATQALSSLNKDGSSSETADDPVDADVLSASVLSARTNSLRSALLCTTTAFALLSSQELATLNLDLTSFSHLLYTLLVPLSSTPDLELSHKTPRLADPHAQAVPQKVNATALSTLLVRALSAALAPRSTPPLRLASFAHRLAICALQVPEKTATALVALIKEIARNHGRKVRGIWNTEEQRGDGKFDPLGGLESCKPFCGTVWEGELLRLHFAKGVRDGMGELEKLVKDLG